MSTTSAYHAEMTEHRFHTLPEPIRLEDTVASQDEPFAEPVTDLVDSWLLRNAAG